MASYNIKHIEYLRQKANLTYEQAVSLLDRNDGDIGKALIELEKSGALGGASSASNGSARSESESRHEQKPRSFWDNAVDLFIKGLRIKLVIEKNHEVIVRLPIIYLLLGVVLSLRFALLSVVLMFLTGCRVQIEHYSNPDGDRKIRSYARGAERTVRHTVDNMNRRMPYNSRKDDGKSAQDDDSHDDFDSFTIE